MFGARPRKEITNKQNGRDRKTTENKYTVEQKFWNKKPGNKIKETTFSKLN